MSMYGEEKMAKGCDTVRGGSIVAGTAGVGAQVRGGASGGKNAPTAKTSGSAVGVSSGKKMPQPHAPIKA